MESLPHTYNVEVTGDSQSNLASNSGDLPTLMVCAPKQFGGPGDQWSPEDLLVAAVANCFVLSFRAVSRASKLQWNTIQCESSGTLDNLDKVTRFTSITTKVTLTISSQEDTDKAHKLLEKAEKICLVTNSLNCESNLEAQVKIA